MGKSIVELVDNLPADNITVKVLKALDFIVPGEWENLVGFDNAISQITGETKSKKIKKIRKKAEKLYDEKENGYQTAIWIYQTLDTTDKAVGAAALANKIGNSFSFIPFLKELTPRADTLQSIDLKMKLVAELIAYSKLNGLTLSPQKFAASLKENYQNEALMRMVALVCIDGVLPLGTNFVPKIENDITQRENLENNPAFSAVSKFIPSSDKTGFINDSFKAVDEWMAKLTDSAGLSRESIASHLSNFIDIADDKLDYLAAFLDTSTNYFEHTGIQTVARKVIKEAYQEID
ncbi:hypothetical protein Riv7116_3449 [Rivularia sp. PCC 7116]|uniref:hypothetical protein n=1 Tax=Rivularia sp. PCC 7116 TaxID=373994 RepID=UPI00029F2F4D|nr:hypothetical protein [Rivularia sp. PCC 7116]AFY55904.1 hypothetical protein Riv7116_3449 [Rivularia sp. PCC 7116]